MGEKSGSAKLFQKKKRGEEFWVDAGAMTGEGKRCAGWRAVSQSMTVHKSPSLLQAGSRSSFFPPFLNPMQVFMV
jgi:hypothetical protein